MRGHFRYRRSLAQPTMTLMAALVAIPARKVTFNSSTSCFFPFPCFSSLRFAGPRGQVNEREAWSLDLSSGDLDSYALRKNILELVDELLEVGNEADKWGSPSNGRKLRDLTVREGEREEQGMDSFIFSQGASTLVP